MNLPFVTTLIRTLHEEFKDDINTTLETFPRYAVEKVALSEENSVSERTIKNYISGNIAKTGNRNLTKSTKKALHYIFDDLMKKKEPTSTLDPDHFSLKSLEDFQRLSNFQFSNLKRLNVTFPKDQFSNEDLKSSMKELSINTEKGALYYIYKPSFQNKGPKNAFLNKEILHIYYDSTYFIDGGISFSMYFKVADTTIDNKKMEIRKCSGIVMPIGGSYIFFGLGYSNINSRGRTLILKKEGLNEKFNKYRFGILSSSIAGTYEPASSRVVLERIQFDSFDESNSLLLRDISYHNFDKFRRSSDINNLISEAISNKAACSSDPICIESTNSISKMFANI